MTLVNLLAGIAWDPEIRGLLAVATGVVVLMGSVYLLLGTNVGVRLGFLISLASFFGFMAMLCFIWWIYVPLIGPAGRPPSWHVIEMNQGDLAQASLDKARTLDTSGLPDPEELGEATPEELDQMEDERAGELDGWKLVSEADPARGEAQAAVDNFLTDDDDSTALTGFDATDDYVVQYVFETGGKPERDGDGVWDRVAHKVTNSVRLTHPPRYALIQVQGTVEQEQEPGAPPPTPEVDEEAPVVSVILERDLGERRLPAGLATIGFTLLFVLTCWMLHRRDARVTELRALPVGG